MARKPSGRPRRRRGLAARGGCREANRRVEDQSEEWVGRAEPAENPSPGIDRSAPIDPSDDLSARSWIASNLLIAFRGEVQTGGRIFFGMSGTRAFLAAAFCIVLRSRLQPFRG